MGVTGRTCPSGVGSSTVAQAPWCLVLSGRLSEDVPRPGTDLSWVCFSLQVCDLLAN